jgi:hypothetical protein
MTICIFNHKVVEYRVKYRVVYSGGLLGGSSGWGFWSFGWLTFNFFCFIGRIFYFLIILKFMVYSFILVGHQNQRLWYMALI